MSSIQDEMDDDSTLDPGRITSKTKKALLRRAAYLSYVYHSHLGSRNALNRDVAEFQAIRNVFCSMGYSVADFHAITQQMSDENYSSGKIPVARNVGNK